MNPERLPTVLIIGRPNVGKSALFNRLVKRRKSIVHSEEGVTRDLVTAEVEWAGRFFELVDSGGLDFAEGNEIRNKVQKLTLNLIERADLVLLIVDGKTGIHPLDQQISKSLLPAKKKVILVVNKIDNALKLADALVFYALPWGDPIAVSGLNGFNIGELLDAVVSLLPEGGGIRPSPAGKIAIVGRPNVGKSSLLNALLGEERTIVSSKPGTTRDSIDTFWHTALGDFLLIDTAGIKRKSRLQTDLEYYSILRAEESVSRADIAILVLDAQDGISAQDKAVAGLIQSKNKACIIVINKCDLVDFSSEKKNQYHRYLRKEINFLPYALSIFVSARTGLNLNDLPCLLKESLASYQRKVSTSLLNRVIQEIIRDRPPPESKKGSFKLYYATQKSTSPPTFICFVNRPDCLHFSYRRHLNNELISRLKLKGTPISLKLKERRARLVADRRKRC